MVDEHEDQVRCPIQQHYLHAKLVLHLKPAQAVCVMKLLAFSQGYTRLFFQATIVLQEQTPIRTKCLHSRLRCPRLPHLVMIRHEGLPGQHNIQQDHTIIDTMLQQVVNGNVPLHSRTT